MPDQNIALGVQVPDAMKSISGMLNFAGQALDIRKKSETLAADIAKAKAESATAQTESGVSAATARPRITSAEQTAQQAEIKSNLDRFKLTGEYAQRARDIGNQLVSDPDVVAGNAQAIIPKLSQAKQMMIDSGVPADVAEVNVAHLIQSAASNPKGFRQVLLNSIQAGVGSSGQANLVQERGTNVTNQQQSSVVSTNPFGATPVGQPIPGTTQQQQLPPQTQTVGLNGQAQYLGPQPASAAPRPVPAGNAPGFNTAAEGTAEVANKDWQDTTKAAGSAAQNIGVLQNIKKYAPGAITGVESDRRSYTTALAGLLGMPEEQMARTSTDILAKNSAMLALAGGNTDLARTMAESANPNTKMTPQAIQAAADQVIAQQKLALKKQAFMRPFKAMNDPAAYSKALTEFNQIADPRVLQVKDMSAEEITKMKAAMSPSEQTEFRRKIQRMKEFGILDE